MAMWYVSNSGSDSNTGNSQAQAYATIAKALTSAASGDTIAIQTGTYTITTAMAITQTSIEFQGYGTTPGDYGTPPLITTSTNNVTLFTTSGTGQNTYIWDNLHMTSTAGTPGNGILQLSNHDNAGLWIVNNCLMSGFFEAVNSDDGGVDYTIGNFSATNSTFQNCTGSGLDFYQSGATVFLYACTFYNNPIHVYIQSSNVNLTAIRCTFAYATGTYAVYNSSGTATLTNCVFYNNHSDGYTGQLGSFALSGMQNCVFYGNPGTAVVGFSLSPTNASRCNAFGNNGSNGWAGSQGDVTLTADPFVSGSTGNFALNATSGGGAALKAAGLPANIDIGATQSSTGGGGGGNVVPVVNVGMCGGMRG